jgi:hypothetical protein
MKGTGLAARSSSSPAPRRGSGSPRPGGLPAKAAGWRHGMSTMPGRRRCCANCLARSGALFRKVSVVQ